MLLFLLLFLVCFSLVINFLSNYFIMQQMSNDRWNKFKLVVLSIDTLLYYEICTKTLSKWFHNGINYFIMQQMPIDSWNKFELVILSIDTLLYYEIPRPYQSDIICSRHLLCYTIQLAQVQSWLQFQNFVFNVFHNIM